MENSVDLVLRKGKINDLDVGVTEALGSCVLLKIIHEFC